MSANPFQTSELLKSLSNYPVSKGGDLPGHEFHGNQHTGGIGGGGGDARQSDPGRNSNPGRNQASTQSNGLGSKIRAKLSQINHFGATKEEWDKKQAAADKISRAHHAAEAEKERRINNELAYHDRLVQVADKYKEEWRRTGDKRALDKHDELKAEFHAGKHLAFTLNTDKERKYGTNIDFSVGEEITPDKMPKYVPFS